MRVDVGGGRINKKKELEEEETDDGVEEVDVRGGVGRKRQEDRRVIGGEKVGVVA